MFNIILKEKSNKISFKALSVKMQRSKNRQGAQCGHGADRKEKKTKKIKLGVVLNLGR